MNRVGAALFGLAGTGDFTTYDGVQKADTVTYARFAEALLDEGVHVIPRGLLYVSTEHRDKDLSHTREAVRRALTAISG